MEDDHPLISAAAADHLLGRLDDPPPLSSGEAHAVLQRIANICVQDGGPDKLVGLICQELTQADYLQVAYVLTHASLTP